MDKIKRNKIFYWIFTIWMSFGMVSTGIFQIMKTKEQVDMFIHLGYPLYFLTLIGIWKLLGVAVALIPKFPLLKEWAYAGFFFVMSGGVISHLIMGDSMNETLPPLFLLSITAVSWFLRPPDRKILRVKNSQMNKL